MQESGLLVRSAGISQTAVKQTMEDDLEWANLVFVMKQRHIQSIEKCFLVWARHTHTLPAWIFQISLNLWPRL